jgi:hypothetical protein
MRKLLIVTSVIALSLTGSLAGVAAPATAGGADDLLFPSKEASNLTELAAHQPYWALLSECAGVFGAASNFESARGNERAAAEDKATGASMLNDAIGRLVADHGISEQDALAFAGDQVNVGREQGGDLLAHGDIGGSSRWNFKRSACLEIQTVYHHDRHRRG